MMPDALAGWQKLAPGDMVAQGLVNKGPLTGWVQSTNPEVNAQAMRDRINPEPAPPPNWFQRTIGATPLGKIGPAPIGMAVPPAAGVLGRTAFQAGAGALESLMSTDRRVGRALTEAGKSALFNLGGEALGKGVGLVAKQRAASALTKGYEEAVAGREKAITVGKEAFEAAKTKFAKQSAAKIAGDLKSNVPALSGFAADEKGLADMLYGKGKNLVHREFDKSLNEAVKAGRGKSVNVPEPVAEAYDLPTTERVGSPFKGGMDMIRVDAGQLANAALGTWRRHPGEYRKAMEALDKAGIGDPKARAAYKYYTGQLDYFNATKALKGEKFDPMAYRAGATGKNVEILRRRGIGSLTEGPMEHTKGSPLAPQIPPEISKPPISASPAAAKMLGGGVGHAVGFGLGGLVGHPWMGSMLGGPAGAFAASRLMPQGLVTQAPINPVTQNVLRILPQLLANAPRAAQ